MPTNTAVIVATAAVATFVAMPLLIESFRRVLLGRRCPPQAFSLSCSCGRIRATVCARDPLHLICHCDDCQAYVAWTANQPTTYKRQNTAQVSADASGGVRTVQVFKAEIAVSLEPVPANRGGSAASATESQTASDLLEVTRIDPRLVPEGRPFTLLRVHATCCSTPLFNTWRELPTISFFASAAAPDGGSGALALLQPPEWRLNTEWAQKVPGQTLVPPGSFGFSPFFLARFLIRNWVFGSRGSPAPFPLPSTLEACKVWCPMPHCGTTDLDKLKQPLSWCQQQQQQAGRTG